MLFVLLCIVSIASMIIGFYYNYKEEYSLAAAHHAVAAVVFLLLPVLYCLVVRDDIAHMFT